MMPWQAYRPPSIVLNETPEVHPWQCLVDRGAYTMTDSTNRANSYLRCALQSAVSQTYKNIEIIVSDNCSPDNTESVVREFDDPRIRYYRQNQNIGPFKNFDFCLEQARGGILRTAFG